MDPRPALGTPASTLLWPQLPFRMTAGPAAHHPPQPRQWPWVRSAPRPARFSSPSSLNCASFSGPGLETTSPQTGSQSHRDKVPQSWLKTTEMYPVTVLGTGSPKARCQGHAPGDGPSACPPVSVLLAALGWQTCHFGLRLCPHSRLLPVCLSTSPSPYRTGTGLGPTLAQCDFILPNYTCKDLFPHKVTSAGTRGQQVSTWTCVLGGAVQASAGYLFLSGLNKVTAEADGTAEV